MKLGTFAGGNVQDESSVNQRQDLTKESSGTVRTLPSVRLGRAGLLVALALGGLPLGAQALSLGEISVASYLNEPFRASVPLTSLKAGEIEQLQAQLAPDRLWTAQGLEKSSFLVNLRFEVIPGRTADAATLNISSDDVAREPFFSFLLQVSNQAEKLVREYTVLLDPNRPTRLQEPETAPAESAPAPAVSVTSDLPSLPTGDETAPARTAPAQTSAEPASSQASPAAPAPAPPAPVSPFRSAASERAVSVPNPQVFEGDQARIATPVPKPVAVDPMAADGQTYGPVKAGETLWVIARTVRPSERVTMNQVMWALFSNNPDQFDGNLNLVKRGAVLAVPSEAVMRDVSPAEAAALVADERARHEALLASSGAGTASTAPQALSVELAPVSTPRPRPTAAPRPQAVTPAEPQAQVAATTPAPTAAPALQEPQAELELVPEESSLDEEAVQDEALSSEAQDFESLPELPVDEEFAALDEDEAYDPEAVLAEEDLASEELPPLEPSEDRTSGGMSYLPFVLGGALILALLAFLGLRRRKSDAPAPVNEARRAPEAKAPAASVAPAAAAATTAAAAEPAFSPEDTAAELPDFDDTAITQAPVAKPKAAEPEDDFGATAQFEATGQGLDDLAATGADAESTSFDLPELDVDDAALVADAADETSTLDLGSETVSLELSEDPISEADFQLAYGLYDEAALLLQRAIEQDPDRIELREKLAETYFAAGEADKFKAVAEAVKTQGADPEVWQRVCIMGQQLCPDDALFSDAGSDLGGASVDLDMDFDGDASSPSDEASGLDDNLLEFSLDDEDTATSAPSETAAADDDNLLEFDLGDDAVADSSPDEIEFDAGDASNEAGTTETTDDLPDLGELDLGDLEAELESGGSEDDLALELDDFGLEDDSPNETAALAADDLPELTTDFDATMSADDLQVEQGGAPDSAEAADLGGYETIEDIGEAEPDTSGLDTDFELDDLGSQGAEEADLELSPGQADPGSATDFDLDDLGTDTEGAGASDGDFDLGDLDIGSDTDFDLGELEEASGADGDEDLALSLDDLGADSGSLDDSLDLGGLDAGEISGGDEAATKLDLARAYVDMGESDMARSLLGEVMASGDEGQKSEAQELLDRLG